MSKIKKYTYLFADLVGSTNYKEKRSYENGKRKIKEHCSIVINELRKYDGEVFKLVGDGVIGKFKEEEHDKNLFDRTLKAAFSILLSIDKYNEEKDLKDEIKHEEMMETRIGIGFGKVNSYNYKGFKDDIGECIDISARLSSIALPNTILFETHMSEKIVVSKFKEKYKNNDLFKSTLENIYLKGKASPVDLTIIGLNDIKKEYPCIDLISNFKSRRSIEEVIYIAIGGFMYSNKDILAKKIAEKLNGQIIPHNELESPYLKESWEDPEKNKELATKTNIWFLWHHYNCIKEALKSINRFDIFVSNFYLGYDLLYSGADYANIQLINDLYNIIKSSIFYKEPDFKIFLEAPPDYYLSKKEELIKTGEIVSRYEKSLDIEYYTSLDKNYDYKFKHEKDDSCITIDISKIFKKKIKIDENIERVVKEICSKIRSKLRDGSYRR